MAVNAPTYTAAPLTHRCQSFLAVHRSPECLVKNSNDFKNHRKLCKSIHKLLTTQKSTCRHPSWVGDPLARYVGMYVR